MADGRMLDTCRPQHCPPHRRQACIAVDRIEAEDRVRTESVNE